MPKDPDLPPHDALFKAAFRDPDAARSLLHVALPREVLEALELSTLRLTEGSFVNDELRERFADLLLEVTSCGEPTLLHVLVEHKSQPARFTVLNKSPRFA